jgi:hypothetical protein
MMAVYCHRVRGGFRGQVEQLPEGSPVHPGSGLCVVCVWSAVRLHWENLLEAYVCMTEKNGSGA